MQLTLDSHTSLPRPAAMFASSQSLRGAQAGIVASRSVPDAYDIDLPALDELTGYPNRSAVLQQLSEGLLHQSFGRQLVSVILFELHPSAGPGGLSDPDALEKALMQLVGRFQAFRLQTDLIARLDSGVFAVVRPSPSRLEGAHAAAALHQVLSKPVMLYNARVHPDLSMQVQSFHAEDSDESTWFDRISAAIPHHRLHNTQGRVLADAGIQGLSRQDVLVDVALRNSLLTDGFVVYYQPIVDLRSGLVAKVEALLRWKNPVPGYEGPQQFIAVAEKTGLIVDIGAWVMKACMRQSILWRSAGAAPVVICVNVSTRQFHDPRFESLLMQAVHDHLIDPAHFELELTESLLADNSADLMALLERLRSLGFRLALDDFGTGYSSLSYLQRYHFNTLKIDKSFVHSIHTDRRSQALALAIIAMGHGLDLAVVGEGVESQEQFDFLQINGCDYIQGFFTGKPALPV